MAIMTLAETLQAARVVASTDNIPAETTAAANPLYLGAVGLINIYAPNAPDVQKNLALERLFGWFWAYDQTGSRRPAGDPLVHSGAASILNRWRTRRAGVIRATTIVGDALSSGLTVDDVIKLINQHTGEGGGGLTQTQVDARIDTLVPPAQRVPTFGADDAGEVVQVNSDGTGLETAAPAAGGLDQDAVDGRIDVILDAAIPQNRRIPPFAVGDAGEVVKVNNTGTGLVIEPESTTPGPAGPQGPAGPTGPQGPPGSGGGTSNELSVLQSLPAVGSYSVGDIINLSGVLYELVSSGEDQSIYRGIVGDSTTNSAVDSGFKGDAVLEWQEANPQNRRLYVPKSAPAFSVSGPNTIYVRMTTPAVPGEFPNGLDINFAFAKSSGDDRGASDPAHPNTYAYHKPSGGEDINSGIPVGTQFTLQFFADTNLVNPINYHNADRWERDDRNEPDVNAIALARNTDRWPKSKLPSDVAYGGSLGIILPVVNPGLTMSRTDTDTYNAAAAFFTPNFNLALHSNSANIGEFHCALELTIAPVSDVNMGFEQGKANQTAADRMIERTQIVFASQVVAEDPIQATGAAVAPNGIVAFRIPVYSLNTIVGYYGLAIVRNSGNDIGYYPFWDAEQGGTGATITASLRISFTPADEQRLVIPLGNSRGRLLATSTALPTASQNTNVEYVSLRWTLEANSGLTARNQRLFEPKLRIQNDQIGYWFVVEIGGVEFIEFLINHNPSQSNLETFVSVNDLGSQSFRILQGGGGSWQIRGNNSGVPPNTVIKVYLASIVR